MSYKNNLYRYLIWTAFEIRDRQKSYFPIAFDYFLIDYDVDDNVDLPLRLCHWLSVHSAPPGYR